MDEFKSDLKNKTIKSMIWSAFQRFGTLILSFLTNLVLARFLSPDDFACIGLLTVFINLCETLIDSGLSTSLIQKDNPSDTDYSTVFWINLFLSFLLYYIIFLCAPIISRFYNIKILSQILRIKSIIIIIEALRLVQFAYLKKTLNFKKISKIYLLSSLISCLLGIISAIFGYGVWSLVIKNISEQLLRTILMCIKSPLKPKLKFSWDSFKEMFNFGGLILITSIVMSLYQNVVQLIMGKISPQKELGYYTQAKKLEDVPVSGLNTVVNQVSFPVFSKIKNDKQKMVNGMRKNLKSITFINIPFMSFCFIFATELILFFFTDKWLPSVPYFKYLCFVGIMLSTNTINTNILKATGQGKTYFFMQVGKRFLGLIILLVSGYFFNIKGLMISIVCIEYIFFIINALTTQYVIGYTIIQQILDILPNIFISFITALIMYYIKNLYSHFHVFLLLLISFVLFCFIYFIFALITKNEGLKILMNIIKEYSQKLKSRKNC